MAGDATAEEPVAEVEPDPVMLGHYLAAITEIYELRAVLAHEADTIEAHLQLRAFPASRRPIAQTQVLRMRAAVRRPAKLVYGDRPFRYAALRRLGLGYLSRTMWEGREQPRPLTVFPPPKLPRPLPRRRSNQRWLGT